MVEGSGADEPSRKAQPSRAATRGGAGRARLRQADDGEEHGALLARARTRRRRAARCPCASATDAPSRTSRAFTPSSLTPAPGPAPPSSAGAQPSADRALQQPLRSAGTRWVSAPLAWLRAVAPAA